MANNLKKFATEAEYTSATLSYPAVSWVTSGDTVHFDKTAPTPTSNTKVILSEECESPDSEYFYTYNCGSSTPLASISSITFNNEAVEPLTCSIRIEAPVSGTYVAEYTLNGTVIGEDFSGSLAFHGSSDAQNFEMLIPSQITNINYLPTNIGNLVIEATTPPTLASSFSGSIEAKAIYVPDASVNTYKADSGWSTSSNIIYGISEYQGNLPV